MGELEQQLYTIQVEKQVLVETVALRVWQIKTIETEIVRLNNFLSDRNDSSKKDTEKTPQERWCLQWNETLMRRNGQQNSDMLC